VKDLLDIVFNESTVEISKRGVITGEIYFQFEDLFFPEIHWNDFIVVILTWWNQSLDRLNTLKVGTSVEFSFMDGPFYVCVIKKSEETVALSFLRRTLDNENVYAIVETNIFELKRSIVKTSKKVLGILERNTWQTDDVTELKKVLSK
jgi:hypothetical protein